MSIPISIQFKRSYTAGKIPLAQDLNEGEFALNMVDRKVYTKDSSGNIFQVGVVSTDFASVAFSGNYSDLKNIPANVYTLPPATQTALGGVKAGAGLAVTVDGTLSNFITSIKGSVGPAQSGAVVISPSDLGLDILNVSGKIDPQYLPSSISGATNYMGLWDASTNTPTIPVAATGNKGNYYIVSVAGTTDINGISSWVVTDQIISDGTQWAKITGQPTTVVSLNGMTGIVTLNASNLPNLSQVGKTNNYTDLSNIPATFPPSTHNQSITTITGASTVAATGQYSDLLGLPVDPNIKNLGVCVAGNPVIYPSLYIFTQKTTFSQNFAGSTAYFVLVSGTNTSVSIKKASAGTSSFSEVGTITSVSGAITFTTDNPSSIVFNPGDILRYDWNNTNIANASITLQGSLQ